MKQLCNDDITKMGEVMKIEMESILNWMVINKQEYQKHKYENNKNKIAI